MAHVEHFKLTDIKRITNEFEREPECNNSDNRIDDSRTKFNYELQPRRFHKELSSKLEIRLNHVKHSTRKDLNVMSSWIITCPQELLDNSDNVKKFFEISYKFCQDRYGADNVLNGYVHMDEKTPHMHTPIVPVKDDRVSAKALFTRKELSSFHSDLDKLCEKEFGIKNLVKNGMTKGNYTVNELKERSLNENLMDTREEHLNHRERMLNDKEQSLKVEEYALKARESDLNVKAKELQDKQSKIALRASEGFKQIDDILSSLADLPSPDNALATYAKSLKYNDGTTVYDKFENHQKLVKRNIRNRRLAVYNDMLNADNQDDNQFS